MLCSPLRLQFFLLTIPCCASHEFLGDAYCSPHAVLVEDHLLAAAKNSNSTSRENLENASVLDFESVRNPLGHSVAALR